MRVVVAEHERRGVGAATTPGRAAAPLLPPRLPILPILTVEPPLASVHMADAKVSLATPMLGGGGGGGGGRGGGVGGGGSEAADTQQVGSGREAWAAKVQSSHLGGVVVPELRIAVGGRLRLGVGSPLSPTPAAAAAGAGARGQPGKGIRP